MDMIKNEWQEIQFNGIDIVVLDTPILNTKNKSNLEKKLIANIVFELLTYMAEKERIKIRTRQAEGIAIAKSKGLYKGRKKIVNENFGNVYNDWKNSKFTAVKAMEMLDMKKVHFTDTLRNMKVVNKLLSFFVFILTKKIRVRTMP